MVVLFHPHQQIRLHYNWVFPKKRLNLLEKSIVFCVGHVGLKIGVGVPAFHRCEFGGILPVTNQVEEETAFFAAAIGRMLGENGCEAIGVVELETGGEVELLGHGYLQLVIQDVQFAIAPYFPGANAQL